jgi:16S rRNA (guanine527-N7)-methyltransferase
MTEKEFNQRLSRRAKRARVPISNDLSARLWLYFELLFRWNRKINLTSLSLDSPDEAIDRLLIEPLLAARQVVATDRQVIDIGSGGGSPAIPLRLALPDVHLVMVESKARKSAFLREVLRHLETDATVETARFEELLTRPEFHETFDVLTLRAVRVEERTLGGLQAFVRPGGRLLLFGTFANGDKPAWLVPPLRWRSLVPLANDSAALAVLEKLRIP